MGSKKRPVRILARGSFDQFRHMAEGFFGSSRGLQNRRGDAWEPPMDVFETDTAVVLKLSLPGVNACDVRITYEGDVVTVCGHREAEPEPDLVAYHRMEIRNGYFERRVIIQKPIDLQNADAEYKDGFLKLSIPKARTRKQRVYTLKIRL